MLAGLFDRCHANSILAGMFPRHCSLPASEKILGMLTRRNLVRVGNFGSSLTVGCALMGWRQAEWMPSKSISWV